MAVPDDHLGDEGTINFDSGSRLDRLRWRRVVGNPKSRHYTKVAGVGNALNMLPFTHDFHTLWRGVTERVFLVKGGNGFVSPPQPEPGFFSDCLEGSWRALVARLPRTAPVSHDVFVARYGGRKRQKYQQALDEMRSSSADIQKEAKLRVFIKYEKTDRTTKLNPVPRVISPRDPKFNIRLGRYLCPLEKKMFKSVDKLFGYPTILKGYNALRTAEILRNNWDQFENPVCIPLDFRRLDQHIHRQAIDLEHRTYEACYGGKHRRRLRNLLKFQKVNKAVGYTPDGIIWYTSEAKRASGDVNTSQGNCLLVCLMFHTLFTKLQLKARLSNNGDDCDVFMEERDAERFLVELDSFFLRLGFQLDVEPTVREFEHVDFCQTRPVFDGSAWIMCRNPGNAIVKDSILLKSWPGSDYFRGWLDAVGSGGMALAGQLPVFQEFYQLYRRSGRRRRIDNELIPYNLRELGDGLSRGYGAVTPAARASFYVAFGVTPDEQICLEEYYANMVIKPELGPFRDRAIFVDC